MACTVLRDHHEKLASNTPCGGRIEPHSRVDSSQLNKSDVAKCGSNLSSADVFPVVTATGQFCFVGYLDAASTRIPNVQESRLCSALSPCFLEWARPVPSAAFRVDSCQQLGRPCFRRGERRLRPLCLPPVGVHKNTYK
jgi:hypothetical protein